jgi:hypothetical protein
LNKANETYKNIVSRPPTAAAYGYPLLEFDYSHQEEVKNMVRRTPEELKQGLIQLNQLLERLRSEIHDKYGGSSKSLQEIRFELMNEKYKTN